MMNSGTTSTIPFHGTTVLTLRANGRVVVAGDGQITMSDTIVKHRARKVRRIYQDRIIVGFAGATADALTLSEKLEAKLEKTNGNLTRAAVELARDWRTDKMLRRLEALMIAADVQNTYLLSGNGDIIEPDEPVIAIGSGAVAAQAAATALLHHSRLDPVEIVKQAMAIAASLCVYTNTEITIEEIAHGRIEAG
ncbi:MAG: ATP-dependent protease subunit HslV [Thermodesulfobacteriota bacterium]